MKQNFVRNLINWSNYYTSLQNIIFNKDILSKELDKFWKEIVETNMFSNQHLLFLFRIHYKNGEYLTIGKLQSLNLEDKEYLLDLIIKLAK